MIAVFLFGGTLAAQEPQVLINDDFEAYTVGNNLAVEAGAAGNDWWTTWSSQPGSSEDGVIAEYEGTKCGYLTYGVDQVLLLGDEQSGIYDLEFDILVPDGKNAYFNILHHFTGTGSGNEWAMECYLHMTGSGSHAAGQGVIKVGGQNISLSPIYDAWMHFRLHVDTDYDIAEYYYTAPGGEEELVHTWQWSMNASNSQTAAHGRKMAALDFYPPQNATRSMYYLDNFRYTKLSGESIAHLTFDQEAVQAYLDVDDATSVDLTISNIEGTTIGDWTGWIDFGQSEGGSMISQLNYDLDLDPNTGTNLAGTCLLTENPMLVEVGAMFTGPDYAGSAMGASLVSVQYPFFEWVDNAGNNIGSGLEANTPVTFRVYGQGLNGQPGEVLAEKVIPYDQVVLNDWTVATFDEPVVLRGFNVWITCEFTQAICIQDQVDCGAVFVFDGSSAAPHGDYYRTGGGGAFSKCSEAFSSDHGNFHLRANCQGNPVSGATWAYMSKCEGSIAIGASDVVTVNFNSYGFNDGDVKTADMVIKTNDPDNAEVVIPVILHVDITSVDESEDSAWKIYPNPATSQVTLEGNDLSSVAIYNVAGQLIRVVKLNSLVNTIDMNVESGVYFFSIYDNNGNNSVQRVVITK